MDALTFFIRLPLAILAATISVRECDREQADRVPERKGAVRRYVVALACIALAGCGPFDPPSVSAPDENGWFIVGHTRCSRVTVDGMRCVYCQSRVQGGYAPALTCDWSGAKP